jgi:hypothetical protein
MYRFVWEVVLLLWPSERQQPRERHEKKLKGEKTESSRL